MAVVQNNKIRVLPVVSHILKVLRIYDGGVLCGGENVAIQAAAVTFFICSTVNYATLTLTASHFILEEYL